MNTEDERRRLLLSWNDEILRGGVMLSEWSIFLLQDADAAFVARADVAAILATQAAMEAHLRYEYDPGGQGQGFARLIDASPLPSDVARQLHEIRRYRNKWVHVDAPDRDEDLVAHPNHHRAELAEMTTRAMRTLREVMYLEQ